jgi:hypothetical protein
MATKEANETESMSKNAEVIESLKRLIDLLQHDGRDKQSAPSLSHYRQMPSDVKKAYELVLQGASVVHATSTKYTLIGKVAIGEQKKLASDLRSGCELIGAAIHVFFQDASGCSRSLRHSALRAALAIFINVLHLVESFEDGTAFEGNVGAQKTGAVWESCDTILNKLLPQGNRNAIRREIFTWTRECNDTMEEFQDMIDSGPAEVNDDSDADGENGDEDDFFGGDDQQYSEEELPLANACLGLVKCSRGCMKLTLEACEALGATEDESQINSIAKLHELARSVGEGMTDLGTLMYPSLIPTITDLKGEIRRQVESIIALQDFVLSLESLPPNVTELVNVLRKATETREAEATQAIESVLAS